MRLGIQRGPTRSQPLSAASLQSCLGRELATGSGTVRVWLYMKATGGAVATKKEKEVMLGSRLKTKQTSEH